MWNLKLRERTLPSLIEDTPFEVPWGAVVEGDDFDYRRSCVDTMFVNTIGVDDGHYSWCPNGDPPSTQEQLAWIWAIRPDLSSAILPRAKGEFAEFLQSFIHDRLDRKEYGG